MSARSPETNAADAYWANAYSWSAQRRSAVSSHARLTGTGSTNITTEELGTIYRADEELNRIQGRLLALVSQAEPDSHFEALAGAVRDLADIVSAHTVLPIPVVKTVVAFH